MPRLRPPPVLLRAQGRELLILSRQKGRVSSETRPFFSLALSAGIFPIPGQFIGKPAHFRIYWGKGGLGMRRCGGNSSQAQGSNLVAVAAALSIMIAQGKTADELAILASLFDLMRSNIALMAVSTAGENTQPCQGQSRLSDESKTQLFESLTEPSSDLFE